MVEVRFTADYNADLARLTRHSVDLACQVRDVVDEFLAVDGSVPESYRPHVLDLPGGCYNGCIEFHACDDDDVLVLYHRGRDFVRMVRVCTHAELSACRFGREWPRG